MILGILQGDVIVHDNNRDACGPLLFHLWIVISGNLSARDDSSNICVVALSIPDLWMGK